MYKNLALKNIIIVVFALMAVWTLYPPNKTLKPGIDLAGGTSLIYEIDAQGLSGAEKKDLANRMITVLRRRIDPANIQNLIWRPQGSTRFEIQMPLATSEARQKRQEFEQAVSAVLVENVNPAAILRSLKKPADQRQKDMENFAHGSKERLSILNALVDAYDQRQVLRDKRDKLASQLAVSDEKIKKAKIDTASVQSQILKWSHLGDAELKTAIKGFADSNESAGVLTQYVKVYSQWAKVVEGLTEPETGKNDLYDKAQKDIDELNLTRDQLNYALEIPIGSPRRQEEVEKLKSEFSDRAELIDKAVSSYDLYYPFRGGLDDPKDLQRMLKGAGILEFRILPTTDRSELTADEINVYVERLKEKGPKYASDNKYIWCEIENADEWKKGLDVVAPFGNKEYVLASNRVNEDEVIAHNPEKKAWKLKRASAGQDRTGRRAINFSLDDRGGMLFGKVTTKNQSRPLCILLDGVAISAPNIQSRITTNGQITGSFSQTEVADMVNKLNAGSLPARLIEQPISVKTIGPSIGADNRDKGIKAGLIGFAVVVFCMAGYYTLAGSIADVALFLNLLFVLAIMAMVKATFTLPGIAGIILTIGMSVDANVLIFERIREEQLVGSSLRIAIKNGYDKAFRTILDANLTTFITAAILYWVASEEIKGFAIVLMLGIVSSMFTALFVTRVLFDNLLKRQWLKNHLVMLRFIKNPTINWMGLRYVFLTISLILIVGGLTVFFTRDDVKNNKYDIEFTGGTSVQINLKDVMTRQAVENRIQQVGKEIKDPAITAANVYSIGKSDKQYEINTIETNKTRVEVSFKKATTPEAITAALQGKSSQLSGLSVTAAQGQNEFVITTRQANKTIVKNAIEQSFGDDVKIGEPVVDEVVNDAILKAFGDQLEIQQDLKPVIKSVKHIDEKIVEAYPELSEFVGGVEIVCDLEKSVVAKQIDQRLKDLRFKPDMQNLAWYSYKILNSELNPVDPNTAMSSFVYISVQPEAGYRQMTDDQWSQFTNNEKSKVLAAAKLETSLPRVTQINPSIGAEAKTQAMIAIVLSLLAIIAYVWVRFGDARYGIAAIIALIHDVCITLGAVTACTYLSNTSFGQSILIGDFKINLAMIAAFLTLIGYSLNDTIVVFDRIRENRHKKEIQPGIINASINQTMSRTLLTSFTTFVVVFIMYVFGGEALRGFTFAIGFGIIIGTYSSIAIASPILLLGKKLIRSENKGKGKAKADLQKQL